MSTSFCWELTCDGLVSCSGGVADQTSSVDDVSTRFMGCLAWERIRHFSFLEYHGLDI